jgi:hypothetical protein
MTSQLLAESDRAAFAAKGYHVARGLLATEEILPLLHGIDRMLCAKAPDLQPTEGPDIFQAIHEKVLFLKHRDRKVLGNVYDAMRKLLPFWAIVGGERMGGIVRELLAAQEVGVVFRGAGIRLDLPDEDEWRSDWHQEYHSQMSSLHGVVAWFNLVPVTEQMGPVRIAEGSHREGLLAVRCPDPMNTSKNYTKTFEIPDVDELVRKYPVVSHETGIGDVVFLDFLLLHESGLNRSDTNSRITCQVRYFDVGEPTGIAHSWKGGWQEGGDFTQMHADKVVPI